MRWLLVIPLMFGVGFVGVHWVIAGAPIPMLQLVPLQPDSRIPTFEQSAREGVAKELRERWTNAQTSQSDGDPERDKLREAVIETATAFRLSPCNDNLKQAYLAATAAYVRAFLAAGRCSTFPSCPWDEARIARANQWFGTPHDARVKEEIAAVHDLGIGRDDYPDKLGAEIVGWVHAGLPVQDGHWDCMAAAKRAAVRAPARSVDNPRSQSRPKTAESKPAWAEPDFREKLDANTRERSRSSALDWLRRPGPKLCTDPDRTNLVNAVNFYYWQRHAQIDSMAVRTPEQTARIREAWSTGIDQQIDGLVRDFVATGYLRRDDVKKVSPDVARLLADVTPGRACAGGS